MSTYFGRASCILLFSILFSGSVRAQDDAAVGSGPEAPAVEAVAATPEVPAAIPEAPQPQRALDSAPVDLARESFSMRAEATASSARAAGTSWWQRVTFNPHMTTPDGYEQRYQWRGLIWQSVEFNVVENGFRVAADPVMRDTLAHRPFWHNYWASLQHFDMGRWNDGDTFIVNYIGHGLHGSVAAMIEIQNSPTDRRLQWGDPGYAKSRWKGFLWATVYSTHSELSPAGEPGVGNQGGFTYGKNCLYKCYHWPADNGSAGSKFTNDTGWVDFVATPTVGMLWVGTEDVLDKYVSERLVRGHRDRFWPMLVRGGLNPSRSFANMLRWKAPWYRDYEQSVKEPSRVYWFPSAEEAGYRALPRVELAPFWSRFTIAGNTPGCFNCRVTAAGGGLEAAVKLHGWLGLDGSVSFHPGASPLPSDRAGGDMLAAFVGLRATKQWRYYAVHLSVRPGVVRFSNAYLRSPVLYPVLSWPPRIATHGGDADGLPVPGVVDANGTANEPPLGAIHHFAWNWQLGLDYRLTKRIAFRVGLEDAVVRYRTDKVDAPGIGVPPYLSWLSKEQFLNRGNFVLKAGPVFTF